MDSITIDDQLILRPWNKADVPQLALLANNKQIAQNLTDKFPHPYEQHHAEAFITMAIDNEAKHVIFAIELSGELTGGIGLHPLQDIFSHNAELGYWLAEQHWGKGIMKQCVTAVVSYGWTMSGIERIFARPFATNIASQKVLEACGFVKEAKLHKTIKKWGVYHDELIYAVRK